MVSIYSKIISKTKLVCIPSEFYFNRVYALKTLLKSFMESLLVNYGPIKNKQ